MASLEAKPGAEEGGAQKKQRRHRRLAAEIERTHHCPVPGCGKSYGTVAALSQHIRLKHRQLHEQQQQQVVQQQEQVH